MRLQVIATGDMERIGLAESLSRVFHGRIARLETLRAQSITATRLPPFDPESVAGLRNPFGLLAFAAKIVAAATISRRRHEARPDLLLVVDDLELANLDQPDTVVAWLRWALVTELAAPGNEAARDWLHERCAFHLLVPMPEAYFFGDPEALMAVGVPRWRRPRLVHDDLERFETDDRDYLVGRPYRTARLHPKHYLGFLANGYSETRHGAKALSNLRWSMLDRRERGLGFARAMFEDVAMALGEAPNPLGPGPIAAATWRLDDPERVLRNI
jgi:hypothetical protein